MSIISENQFRAYNALRDEVMQEGVGAWTDVKVVGDAVVVTASGGRTWTIDRDGEKKVMV